MNLARIPYAALVLLLASAPTPAAEFVAPAGSDFQLCGSTFRFVGFNARGMCHYGRNDVLPYSALSDVAANLNYCTSANARVVRVICAYNGINRTTTGDRLQFILDSCQARGIFAIVAFTDFYRGTQLHPQGDTAYYDVPGCCGLTLLNHQWFQNGYALNYLPQALYLADRFKNHPAVFAWQLGNEIRDISSPSTFLAFVQNMVPQLRAADPNHMISIGLIGYRNAGLTFAQAQQIHAGVSFVSTHNYDGSDADDDSALANALGKPYVIDEAGFGGTGNRTALTNADIQKWLNRGADGYLHWGLMATNYDNGDGDSWFGIDKIFHNADFEPYRSLYNTWGAALGPAPFSVQPAGLTRTVAFRQPLAPDTLVVRSASGTLSFTANASAAWLSATPAGPQAACSGTDVLVQYAADSLAPGVHAASIQLVPPAPLAPIVVGVTLTVTAPPGDFDNDGDVDQTDFAALQLCLTGTGFPQPAPACQRARLDADNDVDEQDVARFLGCMSGAGLPSDSLCLD